MTTVAADYFQQSLGAKEFRAIEKALRILDQAMRQPGAPKFSTAEGAGEYARLRLGVLQREEFHAFWLDTKHRLIASETMFIGTINEARVYPREIVKAALRHNAAAVIVAHNHPSGDTTPSQADIALTRQLQSALAMIDVRLLDHFIVCPASANSMCELGLIPAIA